MSDPLVTGYAQVALDAQSMERLVELVAARVVEMLREEREPPSPFVSVGEAAEIMRCSPGRVHNLTSAGVLSRVKEGRRTLIRRAEIETYLQEGR